MKIALPPLYYITDEEIQEYRKKPVILKLRWLEEQMRFFHAAMLKKAKVVRKKLRRGEL